LIYAAPSTDSYCTSNQWLITHRTAASVFSRDLILDGKNGVGVESLKTHFSWCPWLVHSLMRE